MGKRRRDAKDSMGLFESDPVEAERKQREDLAANPPGWGDPAGSGPAVGPQFGGFNEYGGLFSPATTGVSPTVNYDPQASMYAFGGIDPNTGLPLGSTLAQEAGTRGQSYDANARLFGEAGLRGGQQFQGAMGQTQGYLGAAAGARNLAGTADTDYYGRRNQEALAASGFYGQMAGTDAADARALQARGGAGGSIGAMTPGIAGAYGSAHGIGQDIGAARGVFGQGEQNLGYLDAVQRGEAGPSLAEAQAQQSRDQAVADQMSMAQSGPGGFNAAAQAGAVRSGERIQQQGLNQAAQLRAAEQERARGMYLSALGQQGQLATGIGGLGATQAGAYGTAAGIGAQQAGLGMTQQQIDMSAADQAVARAQAMQQQQQLAQAGAGLALDRGQFWQGQQGLDYTGAGVSQANAGLYQAQQGIDYGQYNKQQQRALDEREMQRKYLGDTTKYGVELEQDRVKQGMQLTDLEAQRQMANTAAVGENKARLLQATGQGVGGLFGALASLSDKTSKKKIDQQAGVIESLTKALASQQSGAAITGAEAQTMRRISPTTFEYRSDSGQEPGKRAGVIAQDLDAAYRSQGLESPAVPMQTPAGVKMGVDTQQLTMGNTAMIADLQRQLDEQRAGSDVANDATRAATGSAMTPAEIGAWRRRQ